MEPVPPPSVVRSSCPFVLPKSMELSPQQLGFLDENFRTHEDLLVKAPHLSSSLSKQCLEVDGYLQNLQTKFTKFFVSWISSSFSAKSAIHKLNYKLQNLSLQTSQYGIGSKQFRKSLVEELPQLVKEVNLIESIRNYAETTLRLEAMVGDLEDAALYVMSRQSRSMFSEKLLTSSISKDAGIKQEKLLHSIKSMNDIEEVLRNVLKSHPRWHCLLNSVDSRVDKIMAALRPQVFADHRALLHSLGWPPKLVTSKMGSGQMSGLPNPLVLMQGDKRESYSHSFVALCALQHLQTQRGERQLNLLGWKEFNTQLWAIDELVSPIASRMEYHFSKWADQPEFMFALVYKVTRDFIGGVDDVLQPLIDKARLVSCSAKEAWVSAMVQMLSGYLAKRVFSLLSERYKEKHMKPDVISSWLHLIDLIIAFDKQMQSLVNLDTCFFLAESERFQGLSRGISVLTIFCDRLEWLKVWAKIELKNAWKKLKTELKEEKAWMICNKDRAEFRTDSESVHYLMFTKEDHNAPSIAEFSVKIAWELIERCQTMPVILSRVQFIRSTAGRFIWHFFKILLLRFKTTELHSDNPGDDAIIRVCGVINSARFVESKLQVWSDDVEFLEMKLAEKDFNNTREDDVIDNDFFYGEEIRSLSEMETNWLMDIIVVLLRQFETLSREYVQKDPFDQEQQDPVVNRVSEAVDLAVSIDFVEALDALRGKLHVLWVNLNTKDFLDLWRSVAEGLDHYICASILTHETQFSIKWINQLESDMQALLFIFQPFCARPQAFFPCIREILKLLKLKKEEVKQLQVFLSNNRKGINCLHLSGIHHLSFDQVNKVLRSRKFGS